MNIKVLKAVTGLVLGAGFLASAVAAPPGAYEEVAVKVEYADLNINNQAGARVLYQRLKDATEEVCGFETYRKDRSFSDFSDARECFSETLTQAVNQIDSEALKDIHTS
jgi:UrcA family protein